jgi:hypothetical protein
MDAWIAELGKMQHKDPALEVMSDVIDWLKTSGQFTLSDAARSGWVKKAVRRGWMADATHESIKPVLDKFTLPDVGLLAIDGNTYQPILR